MDLQGTSLRGRLLIQEGGLKKKEARGVSALDSSPAIPLWGSFTALPISVSSPPHHYPAPESHLLGTSILMTVECGVWGEEQSNPPTPGLHREHPTCLHSPILSPFQPIPRYLLWMFLFLFSTTQGHLWFLGKLDPVSLLLRFAHHPVSPYSILPEPRADPEWRCPAELPLIMEMLCSNTALPGGVTSRH